MLRQNQLSSIASETFLPPGRWWAANDLIAAIRQREETLGNVTPEQLRERADQVRSLVARETPDSPQARIDAFAIVGEALRRACSIRLYDVQLMSAIALANGAIVEMQTGEGKTFACAPAAFLHALTGRGVHVATPNAYLARRDFTILLPVYRLLGIDVGLLPGRDAYRCDITYGTGYEFCFDYLRDQLSLREAPRRQLGDATLESLVDAPSTDDLPIQRGLYYSIVDEADNVLLDDATSPLILSGSAHGEAADAEVHMAAKDMIAELRIGEHYQVSSTGSTFQLTDAGIEWIHRAQDRFPIEQLQRTWTEYVEHALRAATLQRDVHYVVTEGKVQIVDSGTGRIFSDRTWREGLHQAVEAKENVLITPERTALAQITRQRFSRRYQRLAGMTGTAAGCEREFRQVYGLRVVPIPLRTRSHREIWSTRFFTKRSQKWHAIARSVEELHQQHRPVLVGTTAIAESDLLAQLLRERGLEIQLLNGRQTADEAAIIAAAGQQDAVTIATNLAGRGTDIKLGSGVTALGGLHVIVGECSDSSRVDRQLIGRCARQGDPGSAQMFVSAEDAVIQQYGTWLARSIERHACSSGEARVDFSRQLRRIQRLAERVSYSARSQMLRRDLSRDSLFSRQMLGP